MIGSEASATTPEIFVRLLLKKKKKKLCVWSLISLKLSHCLAINLLSIYLS